MKANRTTGLQSERKAGGETRPEGKPLSVRKVRRNAGEGSVIGRMIATGLLAVTALSPAVAARPQAQNADSTPVERFQDCKAPPSQARLDTPAKTIFVTDPALDDAVLKCLNQWGDRNKVRVVLQPVIE